jgi:ferredoxin
MLNALAEQHSQREIWWLHGARSSRQHSFAKETRALLATCSNVRTRIYFSRPGAHDVEGRAFDATGHLSPAALLELEPPRNAQAYICGPNSFMDSISAALASIGVEPSQIHTEPFGPERASTPGIAPVPPRPPHLPAGAKGDGPTVEFARSSLAVPWSSDFASLLELAEACDVPVRWSCRTGVCQTCETTLIAGDLGYDPDPVEPPPEGSALICCSQPRDDLVLDL